MAVRIGLIGIGFMGKTHFDIYAGLRSAQVVAICDVDPVKRSGDWSSIGGNIGEQGQKQDLSGIDVYKAADKMIKRDDIDVVDIALPTYLHAPWAIKALKAGKHVICEKPMAINSTEARQMVDTAKRARRKLFIGQCIRFWPAYAKAREIIRSRKYGKVLSASFHRLSATPVWSWRTWLQRPSKSGLCAMDLHIHDADFILYTFGKPKSVTSRISGFRKGRADHILTVYDCGANQLIIAEAAWEYAPAFGFEMSFRMAMDKATLICRSDGSLWMHPLKGESKQIRLATEDGYNIELKHFLGCVAANKTSDVVRPESARDSVRLIELEIKSAMTGKTVQVKL